LSVWISAQGPIDIRGIMQSTTKKELMRFMIYIMEKNALNMRQNPERCSSQSICVVADMEHLSMWQMAYRPGKCALGTIRKFPWLAGWPGLLIQSNAHIRQCRRSGTKWSAFTRPIIRKTFDAFSSSTV